MLEKIDLSLEEFIQKKKIELLLITKHDLDEVYDIAQKKVSVVLQQIGARNHLIKNSLIVLPNIVFVKIFR